MGNEQSAPPSQSNRSPQLNPRSSLNTNPSPSTVKNVPYAAFSVEKQPSSLPIQPTSATSTQQKKSAIQIQQDHIQQAMATDSIITVKSASSATAATVPQSNSNSTDEVMEQLQSLPQFYPLIKDSIDQSLWRDIFSNSKYSSLQDLDSLDSKMLLEICAEFQTYAMTQSRNVCARQDVIIKQIRNCQFKSNQALADLSQKSEKLKKMATSLREVERLSKYVVDCKKSVDCIVEEIQTLEQLLPQQVVKQIQTPLFSMVKEQQQQQQQQQSTSTLSSTVDVTTTSAPVSAGP